MRFSEIKVHLARFKVGIAGAGGLGSNCAVSLARSGIGTLVITDYDLVDEMNLNRQFYFADQIGMSKTKALKDNIDRIKYGTRVIINNIMLTSDNISDIYSDCDVIVEAFDRADMKEMLIETVQSKLPGIPLVIGSGLAGWGNNETIRCHKLDDFLYVCGDELTEVTDDLPPMAPRVGIVANMQANIVIEILMKKK
jgi:sulfur carrier protein ThiS adenylyltransferase